MQTFNLLCFLLYKHTNCCFGSEYYFGCVSAWQLTLIAGFTAHALQQAFPERLHTTDSISEVYLVPHANGNLSPNQAEGSEARSQPTVLIHFDSREIYAHQGLAMPFLRAHK